jgi:hypothetical protein
MKEWIWAGEVLSTTEEECCKWCEFWEVLRPIAMSRLRFETAQKHIGRQRFSLWLTN